MAEDMIRARRVELLDDGGQTSPRGHTDAAQDIARDLADIAAQVATFKGGANAWLSDPNYNALRLRLEIAHAAAVKLAATVEAMRRVRLNEGDARRGGRR